MLDFYGMHLKSLLLRTFASILGANLLILGQIFTLTTKPGKTFYHSARSEPGINGADGGDAVKSQIKQV